MVRRLGKVVEPACLACALVLPPLLRWDTAAQCLTLMEGLGLWDGIRMACWLLPPAVLAVYCPCLPLLAVLLALALLARRAGGGLWGKKEETP